jgi:hypothetical protein
VPSKKKIATQHREKKIAADKKREKDQTSSIFIDEEVVVIDHVKRKGAKD